MTWEVKNRVVESSKIVTFGRSFPFNPCTPTHRDRFKKTYKRVKQTAVCLISGRYRFEYWSGVDFHGLFQYLHANFGFGPTLEYDL